jgi:hypothetical protein
MKGIEMSDLIFGAARRLVSDKDAWKRPGDVAMVAREIVAIAESEDVPEELLAEAEYLLPQLYAIKPPPVW